VTSGLHARVDRLPKRTRSKLYYAVGLSASFAAWHIDAWSAAAAYVILGFAAAFLLARLLRELRPDRLAGPPEMRIRGS